MAEKCISCGSCGMPMEKPEDFALGDVTQPYCAWCTDAPALWMEKGTSGGPVHLAFTAKTRASVQKFYEAALPAGGKDNGKPGIRPQYHANYYGGFVKDPDGNNIEAVCHQEE